MINENHNFPHETGHELKILTSGCADCHMMRRRIVVDRNPPFQHLYLTHFYLKHFRR